MQAVLDHTIPYVHRREAFGQKIGQFQASGMLWGNVLFHWARAVGTVGVCYGHSLSFPSKMSLSAWNAGFCSMLAGFEGCWEVHHMSPHFLFEMNERGIVSLKDRTCRFGEAHV